MEDPHGAISERIECATAKNKRDTENVIRLPRQFISYENLYVWLKRRFKGLYQYPVSDVIHMVIGNLTTDGTDRDREFAGAISGALNLKKNTENPYSSKNHPNQLIRLGRAIMYRLI